MTLQTINGHAKRIITGNRCRVLADATVDLIARHCRPYIFLVTVTGLPPHVAIRRYTIEAVTDDAAAMKGIRLFVKEMEHMPLPILAAEAT
jgi:hypothetical protein